MSDDREAKRDRSDVHAGRLLAIAGTVAAFHGGNLMRKGFRHKYDTLKHGIKSVSKHMTGKHPGKAPVKPKGVSVRKGAIIGATGLATTAVGYDMATRQYNHKDTPYRSNT
jgi:hypothetical protein